MPGQGISSRVPPMQGLTVKTWSHYVDLSQARILQGPHLEVEGNSLSRENPLLRIMHPRSIAWVGASNNPTKMGTIQLIDFRINNAIF